MARIRVAFGGAGVIIAMAGGAGQAATAGGRLANADRPAARAASAAARCQGRQLRMTVAELSRRLTHRGYVLRFQNRGGACTVRGYPGVDGLSAQGHRLVSARRIKTGYLGGLKPGHPIPQVHLAGGQTASAIVEWFVGIPSCLPVRSLKVTAPDTLSAVTFSPKSLGSERMCDLQVHPVVFGVTGRAQTRAVSPVAGIRAVYRTVLTASTSDLPVPCAGTLPRPGCGRSPRLRLARAARRRTTSSTTPSTAKQPGNDNLRYTATAYRTLVARFIASLKISVHGTRASVHGPSGLGASKLVPRAITGASAPTRRPSNPEIRLSRHPAIAAGSSRSAPSPSTAAKRTSTPAPVTGCYSHKKITPASATQ